MRRLLLAVPALVLVTACGSGPKPAPAAVSTALTRVDRLIAAHQFTSARLALDDLVRRTAAARAAGTLDDQRAQRITAAAAQLAAALPVVTTPPPPSPTPKPAPAHHERKKHKGHGEGD
jgi:hypothetical protein